MTRVALLGYLALCVLTGIANAKSTAPAQARNWKTDSLTDVKASAEAGVAEAQLEMARRCDAGRGVKKDADEAVNWYRKAADAGDIEAQLTLAERLIEGSAREQQEAAQLYQRAADQG